MELNVLGLCCNSNVNLNCPLMIISVPSIAPAPKLLLVTHPVALLWGLGDFCIVVIFWKRLQDLVRRSWELVWSLKKTPPTAQNKF